MSQNKKKFDLEVFKTEVRSHIEAGGSAYPLLLDVIEDDLSLLNIVLEEMLKVEKQAAQVFFLIVPQKIKSACSVDKRALLCALLLNNHFSLYEKYLHRKEVLFENTLMTLWSFILFDKGGQSFGSWTENECRIHKLVQENFN